MPILHCQQCEKEFKAKKAKLMLTGGIRAFVKFCSMECSQKNKVGKKLPKRAKIIQYQCQNCLKMFYIQESHFKCQKRKCCSIECAIELKKKKYEEDRGECISCGKKLSSEQKKFCSNKCRQKRALRICDECGIEFEYKANDADRRFCSNSCYKKSNSETSIERIIREYLEKKGVFFKTQVAFKNYVIDFLLPDIGLVIEADGDYWHSKDGVKKRDKDRDGLLNEAGFNVLRIKEKDIKNGSFHRLLQFLN